MRKIFPLGLRVGLRDADELEEPGAEGIVVGADPRARLPESVHRGPAALVAEVREVAIDVVELGRPLPRLDAAATRDPHGRVRLLERLRPDVGVADLRVLAVERKDVRPRPRLHHQVVRLVVPVAQGGRVDPVREVHVHRGANGETSHEPAAREQIEHRELFGHAQRRIVGGEAVAEHDERRLRRSPRQRGGHQVGRRHEPVGVVVVLVDAQAIEALLLGELELVQELLIEPPGLLGVVEMVRNVDPDRSVLPLEVFGQKPVRHEVEEADFHGDSG